MIDAGRCFADVINISVQHILAALKNTYSLFEEHLHSNNVGSSLGTYGDVLRGDPVGRLRKLVSDYRVSGQQRSALRAVIRDGNKVNSWPQTMLDFDSPDAGKKGCSLPEVQLLRDCETRWSSTFQMIARVLTLYPV